MKAKIMLIDDDYSTNYYHEIILEEAGLQKNLIVCNTVDKALEQLDVMEHPPHIICLDLNMPMKNGWDFLEDYKILPAKSRARFVIILSTTHLPNDLDRINEHPLVYDFWIKPLDVEKIQELLEQ